MNIGQYTPPKALKKLSPANKTFFQNQGARNHVTRGNRNLKRSYSPRHKINRKMGRNYLNNDVSTQNNGTDHEGRGDIVPAHGSDGEGTTLLRSGSGGRAAGGAGVQAGNDQCRNRLSSSGGRS